MRFPLEVEEQRGRAWVGKPPVAIIAIHESVRSVGERTIFFFPSRKARWLPSTIALFCDRRWRLRVTIAVSNQTTIYTTKKSLSRFISQDFCDKRSPERESVRPCEQSIFQPEIYPDLYKPCSYICIITSCGRRSYLSFDWRVFSRDRFRFTL